MRVWQREVNGEMVKRPLIPRSSKYEGHNYKKALGFREPQGEGL